MYTYDITYEMQNGERHTIPVSPNTYDFLDQLMDVYQARPLNPASRVALLDMLTVVFLAGEISGKRKDRARRKGGKHQ
ncbi:hypothetical protein [uncultured Gemmiger sp.]|uniref:hypothetical protein n=1 Tax=Gemmiger sp. TaxID=2049027 RepID=UPI0025E16D49|nr:hypothetical protein [uncultured Gemmiger sp.]